MAAQPSAAEAPNPLIDIIADQVATIRRLRARVDNLLNANNDLVTARRSAESAAIIANTDREIAIACAEQATRATATAAGLVEVYLRRALRAERCIHEIIRAEPVPHDPTLVFAFKVETDATGN